MPVGRRTRVLLVALVGSVLTGYLLMVLMAAAAGLTAGAGPNPAALLTAGVPLWLAAHQVPLTVAGAPLGVLPLVPTAALAAVTSAFAAAAVGGLGGRWGGEVGWVVATLGGGHASLAVLLTALPVDPAPAEPWRALFGGGLVAAAGAGLGALRVAGTPDWWSSAPRWLPAGLAAAATGAAALATAASVLLFAALVVAVGTVHDGFAAWPGSGVGVGVALLAVGYLPNALVAAVSWLAGPGVVIGTVAVSPVAVTVGPLPPLPLLAAMPTGQPPGWAVVVFALPVAAGVLVGLRCRRCGEAASARLPAVAVASATLALGFGLLASVVSGRLAAGPFDPLEVPALGGALALLGWVGLPATLTVLAPLAPPARARSVRPPQ